MSDTQWPLYEVFLQEKEGSPHQSVGAVHAVDAEMALLNARTVFGRRPSVINLWVVPHSAVYSQTVEELAAASPTPSHAAGPEQTYVIFQKQSQRRSMAYVTHVGEVTAVSPQQALQKAIHTFSQANVFVWWVLPTQAITRTQEEDIDSLFAPAQDKLYRQPSAYHTFTAIRKVKQESNQ